MSSGVETGELSTTGRGLSAVAVLAGVSGLAVVVGSLLVWAGREFEPLPTPFVQIPNAMATVYVATGALLGFRVPHHPIGWLFLTAGLVMALVMPLELLVADAYEAFRPAPDYTMFLAWWVSSFATPVLIGLIALAGLVFPDGRLSSMRRRVVGPLIAGSALTLGLTVALEPSGLIWYPTLPNPLAAPAELEPVLRVIRVASLAMLVTCVGAVVVALIRRYLLGDAVTRAQLRWIVYAGLVLGIAVTLFLLTRYVLTPDEGLATVVILAAQLALVLLPLAAAFAITRYRLFGIDVLISRTLVYVPLMGALGGLYALAVAIFQRVFILLTGGTSDAALFIAMFLIAATFTPLRKALEGAVERWSTRDVTHVPPAAGSAGFTELGEAELRETAARLIALRRLEARLSTPGPDAETDDARSLAIDEDGLVACPRGLSLPFTTCLGCPRLEGISTVPPTVRCRLVEPA